MNKIWILAVALLLIGSFTKAQTIQTKGYYSIYRNAEKLNHRPVKVVTSNNTTNNYAKGYYAIGNKHTQLHKGGNSFIVTTPKQPGAAKGYYSIQPSGTNKPEGSLIAEGKDTMKVVREEN